MPFNGSGGFVSLAAPIFPAVPNTTIISSYYNSQLNDIFSGLGNCVTRDGQSPATNNLPMAGFKHTGAANATGTGEYLVYGQSGSFIDLLVSGNLVVQGATTLQGAVTLGDAAGDALVINSSTVSIPNGLTFGGAGSVVVNNNLTVVSGFACQGGTTLGDAAVDPLIINSSTATTPNGLTFNGGQVTINGSNAIPLYIDSNNTTTTQAQWLASNTLRGLIGSGATFTGGAATQWGIRSQGDLLFSAGGTGTIHAQMDTSGRVGVGVVPSPWNTGSYKTIDLNTRGLSVAGGTDSAVIAQGVYNDGAWKYAGTTTFGVTRLDFFDGDFVFSTAPSGTGGAAVTFTERLRLKRDGRLYGTTLHNNASGAAGATNQYIASGTYTPTGTALNNISAITPDAAQWLRVGNVVTVSGSLSVTTSAGGGAITRFSLTLPLASGLTTTAQCNGAGVTALGEAVQMSCDVATDVATGFFGSTAASAKTITYTYTYLMQ